MIKGQLRRELLKTVYVYIAAPYAVRDEVEILAKSYRKEGLQVNSTWHDRNVIESDLTDDEYIKEMKMDMDQVHGSDILLIWDPPDCYHLGFNRHVEVGLAISLGTPVFRLYDSGDEKGRGFYRFEKLVIPVKMEVEAIIEAIARRLGLIKEME